MGLKTNRKIKPGNTDLEETKKKKKKKKQNVFDLNLNAITKGRYKSEEQRSTLENIELLYDVRDAAIKLSNDYYLIQSKAKYESIREEGRSGILGCVAKVSNGSHPSDKSSRLKILTCKQMPQRL